MLEIRRKVSGVTELAVIATTVVSVITNELAVMIRYSPVVLVYLC